jgi:hypothetical protein
LLFDEKSNDFYLAKSAASTDIKFISESERAMIEERINQKRTKGADDGGDNPQTQHIED